MTDSQPIEQPETSADIASLRARLDARPLVRVAGRYAQEYGHPIEHDGLEDSAPPTQRWRLHWRAVLVACVLLTIVAVVLALRIQGSGPGEVISLSALEMGSGPAAEADAPGGKDDGPQASEASSESEEPLSDSADTGSMVLIHVAGAVADPGVFELADQARVFEAVDAAGGALKTADLARVNMARTVTDGEQIIIPVQGEPLPAGQDPQGGAVDPIGPRSGPLDINAASASDFESLPGIGPVLAERIVAHRDAQGPFTSVEQLGDVSGIGPSIMGQIADLVRI